MGAVFDGKTKNGRAVADPGTDDMLPTPGSLVFGAIATPVALSGTIGAHSMLVHGDRWQQIDGNFTESVGSDFKTTVTGNQTHIVSSNHAIKVGGTHNKTVSGTTMESFIGAHVLNNMSVVNETRLGTHMKVHGAMEWQWDDKQVIQYGQRTGSVYVEMYEAEMGHNEMAAMHFEAKGQHSYFSVNDNNCVLFKFETKELNAKAEGAEAKVTGMKGDVKAMQAKAGAVEAKAVAAIPTAGADVNPTPLV